MKILGQPAASEWIDIEATNNPTPFVVPLGQVLTIDSVWSPVNGNSNQTCAVDPAGQPARLPDALDLLLA